MAVREKCGQWGSAKDSFLKQEENLEAAGEGDGEDLFPEADMECFEAAHDDVRPNQRIQLHEFVELWKYDDTIYGRGTGDSEGDPDWTFSFNGKMTDDSTMKLRVSYKRDGKAFTLNETWTRDKRDDLHVKSSDDRRPGGQRYCGINPDMIPAFYRNVMLEIGD